MKKTFLYTLLGLMGIMGTLSIGVVSATEPKDWTVENGDFMTISIARPEGLTDVDGPIGFTIMDRNLGATTRGTVCDSGLNIGVCGYTYQWGNNYGFPLTDDVKENARDAYTDGPTYISSYQNVGYYGTTFLKVEDRQMRTWNDEYDDYDYQRVSNTDWDYWKDGSHHCDLRGGCSDVKNNIRGLGILEQTVDNRKGPCPDGYHVPSAGEWSKLIEYWSIGYKEKGGDGSLITGGNDPYKFVGSTAGGMDFAEQFQIPNTVTRRYTEASLFYYDKSGYYWSSSPDDSPEYRAHAFYIYPTEVRAFTNQFTRASALPVRCFKDEYVEPSQIFTINFTGSGQGSISIGSVEAEEGTSISRSDEVGSVTIAGTVVATGIANEGYVFSGWLTDCVGPTITTACNFTGVFKPVEYTIHFDGNGAEVGNMEDISATYNTNYLINVTADNWFKKVGYIYRGLYTGADISGYTNEEKQALELGQGNGIFNVSNLTTENGAVVTLYPNWGERKYKIVYNANGLNGEIANTECYYENTNCSLSNGEGFYKQGLTLIGWNLSPNGDSTGFDLGTSYSTREIVAEEADKILNGGVDTEYVNLYAVYRPSTFTIVYDGNGGEGSVDSQNITYGDGTTQLNSNSFTREGYHFAGWKGTYNGMTIQFLVNGGSINNNLISEDGFVLILQAQWALDPDYTISYDYDGGAVDEDNPTSYNVETESFTLNRPTKQGYTFDHWEGYSQDEDVTIEQGSTGDRSFKAVYTPNEDTEYRVEHYQENIGGGYSLIDTDYEEGITAETASYTTKDYDGFELASEPLSQTIAADGSTVVRIEYNRKSYELIIINDESTVTGNVKYGEEVILDPGVKNGYSFVRWEGIENLVEDGGTYRMPIADEGLTLTAVWQIVNSTPVAGGGGGRSISSSSSTLVEEHNSASEDKEQNKLEKRLESKELEKNDELKEDDKPLDDVVMSGDENGLDVVEENNDGIDYSQNKVFNHEESVKEKSPSPLTRGEVAVMTNILLEVYPQIIEGKQEINEACSEYADEQDFTSQEKRAITKLCRHAIMGIHEEDDTPLDEFMVSENATEEEFARIVNRVVSNYDDSSLEVVKESLNKLSESKENVVFGTVYDVFMQIKKLFD